MVAYVVRRLVSLVPVLLTVAVVTFVLMYLAPGGPWDRQKPLPAATRCEVHQHERDHSDGQQDGNE